MIALKVADAVKDALDDVTAISKPACTPYLTYITAPILKTQLCYHTNEFYDYNVSRMAAY